MSRLQLWRYVEDHSRIKGKVCAVRWFGATSGAPSSKEQARSPLLETGQGRDQGTKALFFPDKAYADWVRTGQQQRCEIHYPNGLFARRVWKPCAGHSWKTDERDTNICVVWLAGTGGLRNRSLDQDGGRNSKSKSRKEREFPSYT